MNLNAMASPAAHEPGPSVTLMRCRTVAKVDSIAFAVGVSSEGQGKVALGELLQVGDRGGSGPTVAGSSSPCMILRLVPRILPDREHLIFACYAWAGLPKIMSTRALESSG
jgi:hypothetical protein